MSRLGRDERQVVVRIIGIRHRVKRTAQGEARPTQVTIREGEKTVSYNLETETDELDFVLSRLPVSYRQYMEGEDLSGFLPRHLKTKKVSKGDDGKEIVSSVPSVYDGLRSGDKVVMALGGSGDRLAFALSKRGDVVKAGVHRLPGFELNARRGDASKDDDSKTLVAIFETNPELFYRVGVRDRELILLKESYFARQEAQRARIGCEQRLRGRHIGKIFLTEDGLYPDGLIEDDFDARMATDKILRGLETEERGRDADLKRTVETLPVWREIFTKVEGVGPTIAGGIITAVGDVRRFSTAPKLKRFLGVHVECRVVCLECWKNMSPMDLKMVDETLVCPACEGTTFNEVGRFPRRRAGSVANWHPNGRQALYLLAGQFVYRPDSEWGRKLRAKKAVLREKHPVLECSVCNVPWDECKKDLSSRHTKRFTDGHIHKMAMWWSLTKFVEWLHREWWKLEKGEKKEEPSSNEKVA